MVCEYAKLMPNGYVYPCDAGGSVTVEIDGSDPYENSVDGKLVTNLIVDYGVDGVPGYICEYSSNLRSVRFENSSISSIGLHAFSGCSNLADISFSGMTIGGIGTEAFSGCGSLTSLNINDVATIGSIDDAAFAWSGLRSHLSHQSALMRSKTALALRRRDSRTIRRSRRFAKVVSPGPI